MDLFLQCIHNTSKIYFMCLTDAHTCSTITSHTKLSACLYQKHHLEGTICPLAPVQLTTCRKVHSVRVWLAPTCLLRLKEQVPITHSYREIGYLDGYFKYFNGKRNGSTELIASDNRLGILKPNSGSTDIFQPYNSCLVVTMMACLQEGHVSETKPTCPGRAQNQEVKLK